jgi:hypothetical protein
MMGRLMRISDSHDGQTLAISRLSRSEDSHGLKSADRESLQIVRVQSLQIARVSSDRESL